MSLTWETLAPSALGAMIVAVGWVVSHNLSKNREIAEEKRKLRIEFLLAAYRRLERVSERRSSQGEKGVEDLESAIADIQLLGTPEQVTLAQLFALNLAEGKGASAKDLLINLRSTLRNELDLEHVETDLRFLRIRP